VRSDAGSPTPHDSPEILTVQVEGRGAEPERLVLIERPSRGRVRVREWADGWTGSPSERELPVEELYAGFERAVRARRRVSEELARIRAWLDGHAP
jgi:hypothetical protein